MATILEATVTVDRWNPITRVPMARRTWKSAKVRLAVDSRGRKGIEVEAGKQKLYYSLHVPHIVRDRFVSEGKFSVEFSRTGHTLLVNSPDCDLAARHCAMLRGKPEKAARRPLADLSSDAPQPKSKAPCRTASQSTSVAPSARTLEMLDTLSAEQRRVVELVQEGNNVFFTGSAGTGKSRVLEAVLSMLPASTTYATAPTGVAACVIGGTTLHAFAGLGRIPAGASVAEAAERVRRNVDAAMRWRSARALVVDEVSMLPAGMFDLLDGVARSLRGSSRPFGGIQLVLCGDFFQLPPVTRSGETCRLCFESEAWSSAVQATVVLRRVFRQTDGAFAAALDDVRTGALSERTRKQLASAVGRKLACYDGVEATELHTHRAAVDKINASRLSALRGEESRFRATDSGIPAAVATLSKSCPAPQVLSLKVGAQVMLTKNVAPERGMVNGKRGTIVRFKAKPRLPVVRFLGVESEVEVGFEEWRLTQGSFTLACRRQLPLALAWAVSVHKSQGMTLDRVRMDLSRVFECGQAYVALSRVRSLGGLSLAAPLQQRHVRADPRVKAFYEAVSYPKSGSGDQCTNVAPTETL